MATTTKNRLIAPKRGNGRIAKKMKEEAKRQITIPPLQQAWLKLRLVGTNPLMVSNKLSVAEGISDQYSGPGGKAGHVAAEKLTSDESYRLAFYEMPDSKHAAPSLKGSYGVPTSGIKKCFDAAIRTTGITDNITIGNITKAFFIQSDAGGLCRLKYKKLERDVRSVNIGSGKTVPQMRHRPMFHDWSIELRILYNPKILSPEQIVNLGMHAGVYIGLCELRAQKKHGQCGSFRVESID